MADRDTAAIEARLDAGEWLRPGDVAILFNTSRTSVHRWLASGMIRYRRTPGGHRVCHPGDVRRELDAYRREHGGGDEGGPAE